jgi:hypothetical protein
MNWRKKKKEKFESKQTLREYIHNRNHAKGRFREAIRIHVEESSRGALLDGNRARRGRDLGPKRGEESMMAPGEDIEVDTKAINVIENISLYEYHVFKSDSSP